MQNYKDLFKRTNEIWVEVLPQNAVEFLQCAENLGFVWINGRKIIPQENVGYHFAISSNGKLAKVANFAWFSKDMEHIARFEFLRSKPTDCDGKDYYLTVGNGKGHYYLREKHPALR